MNYKLIALDLDETLLNTKKKIPDENKIAIKKALDQGIKVVLCSGRTRENIINYAHELGITGSDQYIITNGGDVIETVDGTVLFKKTFNERDCDNIANFLDEQKISFQFMGINGDTYDDLQELTEKKVADPELEIADIVIHTHKKEIDKFAPTVHQHLDNEYFVVRTDPKFLEIFPNGINKGKTVRRLAKHLKIDMEQVMAMGDMDNDIPMIELAGKGVAMKNGADNVKAVSDYVTEVDNNHGGVGLTIDKFALS